MFDIDGIGKQLDMANFGKQFFSTKLDATADVSVDANANVEDTTVVAYENELPKPYMRLNSLYLLWKGCRKYYDTEFANRMVEGQITGDFYINDFLLRTDAYSMEHGVSMIDDFLGDFFIRKCMWSTMLIGTSLVLTLHHHSLLQYSYLSSSVSFSHL